MPPNASETECLGLLLEDPGPLAFGWRDVKDRPDLHVKIKEELTHGFLFLLLGTR